MKNKNLSQEGLKLIATVTMLIDHVGMVLVYEWACLAIDRRSVYAEELCVLYDWMRLIGRIAFPIYCFMLVEGAHHTASLKKYRVRLLVGALLAEIPFDLAVTGRPVDFGYTSVMVTLFLGLLMIESMQKTPGLRKLLWILPFYLLAELLQTDYAGHGMLLIAMLELTRAHEKERLLRLIGFSVLLWFGLEIPVGPFMVPMELFGILSMVPMYCYSGRKVTRSKGVQWAFYLFYPVHLLVLWALKCILF